jgi:hypothetical protein
VTALAEVSPATAVREIQDVFWRAWKAGSARIAGGTRPVLVQWAGLPFDQGQEPDPDGAWARVTVKLDDGEQSSLAGPDGAVRYRNHGIVFVQCWGPRDAKGSTIALELARLARNSFRAVRTPSGIVFRRPHVRDVGPDKSWWQVNAVAEFSFDEVM